MPLYTYVKAPPMQVRKKRIAPKIFSFLLMSFGVLILLWVAWPILSFTTLADALFPRVVSPVSDVTAGTFGASQVFATDGERSAADLTHVSAWYPAVPQKRVVTPVNTYTLSIPKLKIEHALVSIGSDDLNTSLIHYGGTGLPGQYGTAVIFGHSALPQFYNPTNYKTIFSTLPTLKSGDRVVIVFDGITYTYEIFDLAVVDPADLSALAQEFDNSYITLVTCVPPGTYWKRLNIRAKLVNQ